MVGHIHRGDLSIAVAYHHKGFVPGGKQLVLRQRTAEPVDRIGFGALKPTAQNAHPAALVAGAHKAGVINIAFVGGKNQGGHAVSILIRKRALIARGQKEQHNH